MAHDLDLSTGKPAMAYVGKEPWHGLGEKLERDATIEKWITSAGLDWEILREPVLYSFKDQMRKMPDRHVLIRSDNGAPLSVVSDSYCIVQPKEVVEFYKDLVAGSKFTLETAGALDEGRKVWGLARSKFTSNILNQDKDHIDAFLLLASSCDKSLATTIAFTSIRVVCQNTLNFAMEDIKGKPASKCLKINHNARFNWDEAKGKLNLIDDAWGNFTKKIEVFAATKVAPDKADEFFTKLFLTGKNEKLSSKAIVEIQNLRSVFVNGQGQQLKTAKDTAWGLVNAVTYYVDHDRKSRDQGSRLDSAWFGAGAMLKDKAWETAIEMFPQPAA